MTSFKLGTSTRAVRRTVARTVALAGLLPLFASAASYYQWETITPAASTGASCGNGTPYRFFVNRALSNKTVVFFEGGGACWDQAACQGTTGLLGASNPKGIPTDYLTNVIGPTLNGGLSVGGLVSPFSARIDPLQSVQTQGWNIVYVPYCTGDVHSGNKVGVYGDKTPASPTTYYHRGYPNVKALSVWLGKNLPNQSQLLVTGFSAGGTGATTAYDAVRSAMKPKKSALLADSGPLMQAPRTASPSVAPSVLLHNKIRVAWGIDEPTGYATEIIAKYPGRGDINNLGSLTGAMAEVYPNDRFSYAVFQMDGIYSDFSYSKFFPEIAALPDGAARDALINAKWAPEVKTWTDAMKPYANIGFYIPYKRDVLKSHCLSIISFSGTGIAEANIADLGKVVDNLIDGTGTPTRAYEIAKTTQPAPTSNAFTQLLAQVQKALGL